jgi:hypothetical protein
VWLDRASAELRHIEFDFVRLADTHPPGVAGGRVEFRRLPSGAWIVERWWLRLPIFELDRAGRWQAGPSARLVGVKETGGEVVRMEGRGAGRTFQIGGAPAAPVHGSIAGVVHDSVRDWPLGGATVFLSGTAYRAVTDAAGRFRIDSILPGEYTLAFDHAFLDSLPTRPRPLPLRVDSAAHAKIDLALPSLATLAKEACPELEPGLRAALPEGRPEAGPERGLVFGEVRGFEPQGAEVRVDVRWEEYEKHPLRPLRVRPMHAEVTPDAAGRYVACGVLIDHPLELRVRRARDGGRWAAGPPVPVRVGHTGLLRLDVDPPRP